MICVDRLLPGCRVRLQLRGEHRVLSEVRPIISAAGIAAALDREAVGQFGQRQIEPALHRGPVFIDVQKQVQRACVQLTAIIKAWRAAGRINRIDIAAFEKYPILHLDRGDLAGPNAEEGYRRLRLSRLGKLPTLLRGIGACDDRTRREEASVSRSADRRRSQTRRCRCVAQAGSARRLVVSPAEGQIGDRENLIVNDFASATRGPMTRKPRPRSASSNNWKSALARKYETEEGDSSATAHPFALGYLDRPSPPKRSSSCNRVADSRFDSATAICRMIR